MLRFQEFLMLAKNNQQFFLFHLLSLLIKKKLKLLGGEWCCLKCTHTHRKDLFGDKNDVFSNYCVSCFNQQFFLPVLKDFLL